ncbi:hypothetical protein [Streptomyces sp. NRRL F-5630]|nr:hypothetical protein [Streptomyces sp. NRRL F-5630]
MAPPRTVRASVGAGFAVGTAGATGVLEEPVTELAVVRGGALTLRPLPG